MKIYNWLNDVRVLAFDIDMTLYTNQAYLDAQISLLLQRLADHQGISYSEVSKLVARIKADFAVKNDGRSLSLGNVFAGLGVDTATSARWRDELFHPENFLVEDEKLKSTLKILIQKFKLAAVTNNSTEIGKRTLSTLGVERFFDPVIGLDISGKSKPTMIPFEMVAKHHNVEFQQMVSIGDRFDVDLELPLKNGMGAILVSGVEEVYEIPEIIGKG
jgi:FMN phosphatase YigB (HAD superfamily)